MLLYLTSNQKSNLIDPAVRNMTLPAKKLVGRFSLKSFVTKDMRNYANAKFFVVDAACIEESGNDFTLALQSFQMMFSARIIVILSGYEDVNGEVQRLLSIGVVNLVTGETMEDALDELTEALSEDGMQRYVVKAPVYEQPVSRHEKAPEPDEIIPYRWNARNIRIAVAGSQRRSGVTVTAFNLASWLAARGAEVAYIEVNQNRHLQLLLNIYEAAPDGEHYLPFGGWNECPNTPELMAVAKYWFEQHGAVPAAMSHDELEFRLPAPVPEEKAMDAAVELYGFCPDVIDQGPEDATVGALADVLRQSTVWYFWWD